MRKISITFIAVAVLILSVFMYGFSPVQAQKVPVDYVNKSVKLTDAQKTELAGLHKEILERKKVLISKYVEYGVISEEKGNKMISRMEEHYANLESRGYIPDWDKAKNRHKH